MIQEKTCSGCKATKPVKTGFVRDSNRGDGWYPRCKDCRSKYYHANSSRIRAKMRDYNANHKDQISKWHKQYSARRFFFITASNLKIRSRGESATYVEIARLWKAQRGICPMTLRRLTRETSQLDHIIPLKHHGSSTIENLRWVHRDVNYAKRDLSDADFVALCQEVTLANIDKQRS